MTLLLAHYINHDNLTIINVLGLCLCLFGMIIHSVSKHTKVSTRMSSSTYTALVKINNTDTGINNNNNNDRKHLIYANELILS